MTSHPTSEMTQSPVISSLKGPPVGPQKGCPVVGLHWELVSMVSQQQSIAWFAGQQQAMNCQFVSFKFCSCLCRCVFWDVHLPHCHSFSIGLGFFLTQIFSYAPSWPAWDICWEVYYIISTLTAQFPRLSKINHELYFCSCSGGPWRGCLILLNNVKWCGCTCGIWNPSPEIPSRYLLLTWLMYGLRSLYSSWAPLTCWPCTLFAGQVEFDLSGLFSLMFSSVDLSFSLGPYSGDSVDSVRFTIPDDWLIPGGILADSWVISTGFRGLHWVFQPTATSASTFSSIQETSSGLQQPLVSTLSTSQETVGTSQSIQSLTSSMV